MDELHCEIYENFKIYGTYKIYETYQIYEFNRSTKLTRSTKSTGPAKLTTSILGLRLHLRPCESYRREYIIGKTATAHLLSSTGPARPKGFTSVSDREHALRTRLADHRRGQERRIRE